MKAVIAILRIILTWVVLPLFLAVVFVVVPCYTLGELGWSRTWCGYKGGPPHMEAQFWTGLATGLVIAFALERRRRRARI